MAVNKAWATTGLIGGTSDDLDGIAVASLSNNDFAYVRDGNLSYEYRYSSSSTDTENSPYVIKPDDAGSSGRWILHRPFGANGENLLLNPEFNINQDVYNYSSSIAAGNYFFDGWFNHSNESSHSVTLSENGIIPGDATNGITQLFGKRVFSGANQISGIIEGEYLTVTIGIPENPAYSYTIDTGYGSSSLSTVTFLTSGIVDTNNPSHTFIANYNSVSTNYLAVRVTSTNPLLWIKCERGSTGSPYEARSFEQNYIPCLYYFRKSYEYATQIGAAATPGVIYGRNWLASAASNVENLPCMGLRMASTPTVSIYSPVNGALGEVYDEGVPANKTVGSVPGVGENGFSRLAMTDSIGAGNRFSFHYVLDARP